MKPTLYITCGLPYSGKTCLANKLVKKFSFIKISIDDILFSKGYDWDHFEEIGETGWKSIFKQAEEDSIQGLKNGQVVIYDSANQDKASRQRLRQLAHKFGADFKIIWINIPINILKERQNKNKSTEERFYLPDTLFQAALNSYQPPTNQENYIEFNEKDNLEEWTIKHFNK